MNSFRTYVWDPGLIIAQIICLQTTFYAVQCISTIMTSIGGKYPSLERVFTPQVTVLSSFIQLFSAAFCGLVMCKVVGRSKQCFDFACTLHFWHFVFIVCFNSSFPVRIFWWLLQLLSITLCTIIAEYLCVQIESRDIPLSTSSRYEV